MKRIFVTYFLMTSVLLISACSSERAGRLADAKDYRPIYRKITDYQRLIKNLKYNGTLLSEDKVCFQLIESRSSRLVTVHKRGCSDDPEELLSQETIYFWLTLGENNRDLYYHGYLVGQLSEGSLSGSHTIGDLCQTKPDSGSRPFCSVAVVDEQALGIKIIQEVRKPLIELTGYIYKKTIPMRYHTVVKASCAEPIYDGIPRGCPAIGSAVSSACYAAGFQMLGCNNCEHICSANFLEE